MKCLLESLFKEKVVLYGNTCEKVPTSCIRRDKTICVQTDPEMWPESGELHYQISLLSYGFTSFYDFHVFYMFIGFTNSHANTSVKDIFINLIQGVIRKF